MNAHEHLSDYLLGELAAAERDAFEAALAHDPALRAEVERLRPVVARLDALEPAAWEGAEPPPLPALLPPPHPHPRPRPRAGGAARSCCAPPRPPSWRRRSWPSAWPPGRCSAAGAVTGARRAAGA